MWVGEGGEGREEVWGGRKHWEARGGDWGGEYKGKIEDGETRKERRMGGW